YQMNGESLTALHGAPLRLFVVGLYGFKMPKWITQIDFIDYPFLGFWESRGYTDSAEVKPFALLQSPPHRARIQGSVLLQGIAFAGLQPVIAVEVSIDGGAWLPAEFT